MTQLNNTLRGRVAVVTGASSGIGFSMVNKLVALEARCIVIGRRQHRLNALVQKWGAHKICAICTDLSAPHAASTIIRAFPDNWPSPDILINNAGLALSSQPAQSCSLEDWETMINTNVSSLVRLTHAMLPGLIDTQRADIINMSSVAANYPYPGGNVYGATKAFVKQFSLGLRADLLGTNVRVCSVEPGMCESEFSIVRFNGDKHSAKQVYEGMQPLSPDDVADTMISVLQLPAHVNVNRLEVMPTQQAFAAFAVNRS